MRTGMIILLCALTVAACGNADKNPPRDPSSYGTTTTTTSAPEPTHPEGAHVSSGGPDATGTYRDPNTVTTRGTTRAADASGIPAPAPNTVGGTGTVAPNGTPLTGTSSMIQTSGSADPARPAPDNTKVNERDRTGATLTAGDQGNTPSEIKITAAVRRSLVADKNLSMSAKNVKVITVGSKVTLRGPVKSEQERSTIESVAKQTEGVSEVDNQIEIKK